MSLSSWFAFISTKYDNECHCQHGEPMCWENDHIHQAALKHKHMEKSHAVKVLMSGHHLIELDQHGADEDKLSSKAPSLLPVTDPQFKEIWLYSLWPDGGSLKWWTLSGMDGDDGTPLYPTTRTAGVSPVPLTILHLVKCSFFASSSLGDVGAWQLKCHLQWQCWIKLL